MNGFGILVCGPSGCGKTTFCYGLNQFLTLLDRKHVIVNLDPANENMKYECKVDVKELINLDDVMDELNLGPNGGLIYCIKFLEKNMDWLKGKLKAYPDHYFIFDLPGQTELFVNNDSLLHIINTLTTDEDFKLSLVAVELFDSHYCYDASKFLSVCLYSLTSMINLSLPHINVLSKIDLLKEYGKLPMALKEYLVPDSVKEMIATDKSTSMFAQKYKQLTQKMGEVIDDYALVSFYPLDINDKISVSNLLALLDKANGYGYYMETVGTEKHFDLRNEVAKDDEFLESDRMVDLEEKLFFEQQEEEHERDMEYYRSLKDGKLPEDKA